MLRALLQQVSCICLLILGVLPTVGAVDVTIKRARSMKPLQVGESVVHRLLGEVCLEHDGAVMQCDSAYLTQATNQFSAYGRVTIYSKDLRIVGDSLYYDGQLGLGRIFGHDVVLRDTVKNYTLWSDILDYDTHENSVRFSTWGRMRSEQNELESLQGIYLSDESLTVLTGEVRFQGEELRSFSDTLKYYRDSEMLYLWGNIRIYRQEQVGLCNKGWYNLKTKASELEGSVAFRNRGEHFFADRLVIDGQAHTMEAFGQVLLEDSLREDRVYSEHLYYWSTPRRVLADRNPLLFRIDGTENKQDSLYLRAEKFDLRDEVLLLDSIKHLTDTVYHIWAQELVRSFRSDLQVACDTLYVNGRDSTVHLIGKPYPYLWNEKSQISAENIVGYIGKGGLDSIYFEEKVFLGSLDREENYNQMTGLKMRAYLSQNTLEYVLIEGDGEVIFFMRDEDDLVGINRIKSPTYKIVIRDHEIDEAVFYSETESTILPIVETQQEDRVLYGFRWRDDLRPHSPSDIVPAWLSDLNFYTSLRMRIDSCYWQEGGTARRMQWRHEIR